MDDVIPLAATLAAISLPIGALFALMDQRPVLAGALLVCTAFAIFVRETRGKSD